MVSHVRKKGREEGMRCGNVAVNGCWLVMAREDLNASEEGVREEST